ncbi:MAG: GtrA family protein [Candidatus Omnitrophota bacterium]
MTVNENNKEIGRFLCAGVIATAVDFGIYYLFLNFCPSVIAKSVAFTGGGVAAFFLNKYWTFRQEKKSSSEVARFVAANGLAFFLNVGVNELMLRTSGGVFVSLITATLVTAVFTFVIFKNWVFAVKASVV